jgi:hypothetical protein
VDGKTFDRVARIVGDQTSRRSMIKAAAGSTLAVLGMRAVGRVALGQDVSTAATGFKGDSCDDNGDCRSGLICDQSSTNPRCQYKRSCGGKKGDACKNDGHCCNNRNLVCDNRKCKRGGKNR